MQANWLQALSRSSLGDFAATNDRDRELSRRALLARDDPEERWALFTLLAWKVKRFAGRFRAWRLDPWEQDDVVQETWLVYLDTLRRWKPRYVGAEPAGYLYYFLAVFPRWLESAIRGWRWPGGPTVSPRPGEDCQPLTENNDHAVVDDFYGRLNPEQASLLRLRIETGASVPRAAEAMGIARRTAYRRWRLIVELGREYLREAG